MLPRSLAKGEEKESRCRRNESAKTSRRKPADENRKKKTGRREEKKNNALADRPWTKFYVVAMQRALPGLRHLGAESLG